MAWEAINDSFIGQLDEGYLGTSARLAVMKRAPLLLQYGFWPIFPLFDEKLAAALLSTTADERHEKSALQRAVRQLLGDKDIFGVYEKETLERASHEALCLTQNKVLDDFANARLIDLRIIRAGVISPDVIGDLSNPRNPFVPVLSILHAVEKFVRWNF
ncbi:hypothetical protein ACWGS9_01670 [Bradyrhizobium sp. Arg314]